MGSVYEYINSKGENVSKSIVSILIGIKIDKVQTRIDRILKSDIIRINKTGASFNFCIHIGENNNTVVFSPNYTEFYIPDFKIDRDNTAKFIIDNITIELGKLLDRHLSDILYKEHKEVIIDNVDHGYNEVGGKSNIGNVMTDTKCPHKIHHLNGVERFLESCRIK